MALAGIVDNNSGYLEVLDLKRGAAPLPPPDSIPDEKSGNCNLLTA
jgi:hypothetical protein